MTTPAVSCQSILEVPLERSVQCTDDMAGLNLNPLCPLHSVSRVCHANFSNIEIKTNNLNVDSLAYVKKCDKKWKCQNTLKIEAFEHESNGVTGHPRHSQAQAAPPGSPNSGLEMT